jgi:protein SOK2
MHMPAPNPPHSYVTTSQPPAPGYQPQPQQQHQMDTTGQTGPPGIKPKVTATLWEDEGSLCFQVEAKGVCVARREGTFMQPVVH